MAEGVAQRADSASEARLRRPSRQTGKGVGGREKVPRVHCESLERHSGWMWRLQLKQWYESREALGKQLAKLKIGQYGLRPFGSNQKQIHSRNQSMGCRITKSNVETYQSGVISTLKSFLEFRRMHGLTVYGVVLRDRYMQLLCAEVVKTKCMLLELRDKSKMVSGQVEVDECQSLVAGAEKVHKLLVKRIGVMESSVEKQKRSYWTSVMSWIGASSLRTQRVTRLTPVQVCQRVELTWQSHDYAQWIAVQGSDEQLAEHIRSPIQWRSGLKSTVWVFFDHTPVWLAGAVDERPIYAQFEKASRQARKFRSKQRRQAEKRAVDGVLAEQAAVPELPQPGAAVPQPPVQTVSAGSGATQKARLTLILFQSVEKWFDSESTPVGFGQVRNQRVPESPGLHGVLIVKSSQHCRRVGSGRGSGDALERLWRGSGDPLDIFLFF